MSFTQQELKNLRTLLPKDATEQLSKRLDMKKGSIKNILYGLSNNESVILSAYELAKEYQDKLANTKAALANG